MSGGIDQSGLMAGKMMTDRLSFDNLALCVPVLGCEQELMTHV